MEIKYELIYIAFSPQTMVACYSQLLVHFQIRVSVKHNSKMYQLLKLFHNYNNIFSRRLLCADLTPLPSSVQNEKQQASVPGILVHEAVRLEHLEYMWQLHEYLTDWAHLWNSFTAHLRERRTHLVSVYLNHLQKFGASVITIRILEMLGCFLKFE